jgi:adenosylhomocysteine nucleosidase
MPQGGGMMESILSRPPAPPDVIGGRKVLFVMATEIEYGAHLRSRIRPLITGVGPVEAALSVAIALLRLESCSQSPDLVVSLGSAGSQSAKLGVVYQVASVSWRDIDASPLGFTKGITPFVDHPIDTPLPTPIDGLEAKRLSTGADVVSGSRYRSIDADMVDMETFAVLRACQRFAKPLIGLRGISDGARELGQLTDWTELLEVIDEKLAHAVDHLAVALETGRI